MEQHFFTIDLKTGEVHPTPPPAADEKPPQRKRTPEGAALLAVSLTTVLLACAVGVAFLWGAASVPASTGEAVHIEADKPPVVYAHPLPSVEEMEPPVVAETPAVAQAPFYPLTDYEREMVERVVFAESGNQSLEGQMAVAQCILNTALAEGIGPVEVVEAPNQYASPAAAEKVTEQTRTAVAAVFDRGLTVTEDPIRWFYAPKYSRGTWHESALEYVLTIGGHRFFKEKR